MINVMHQAEVTDYDGCGKCLVGVRRLSRTTETTNSPEKQGQLILRAASEVGAHIIAWADDWEVSGATDPMKRPKLGPWLRGEKGPYDGIAGAAVDRIGRNARDVLNTAYTIHENGQILITADHHGIWDLDDSEQESELLLKALGAQLEHRSIKKRVKDEHARARNAGEIKNKLTYGYMYIRLPSGRISGIGLHPDASKEMRRVKDRIMADTTGNITIASECARLTRERVLTPHDLMAVMAGREPEMKPWTYMTLRGILWSYAALGYLVHKGKPVIGKDGKPVKVAPALWDAATRQALIAKTQPKQKRKKGASYGRAAHGTKLLAKRGTCGNCGDRLKSAGGGRYICKGRVLGVLTSQKCRPAPSIKESIIHPMVEEWFCNEYGNGLVRKKEWIPGTDYAAQIIELEEARDRMREDRQAGIYDSPEDAEWFRREYKRMSEEIAELKKLPERPGEMKLVPTGETVAEKWKKATDDAERRELLEEFEVEYVLFPADHEDRVKITGKNIYDLSA